MAQSKKDRRTAVDKIRREQKRADQRQGAIIVGVCIVIALIIVGLTAYRPVKDWWDLRKFNDMQLAEIGGSTSSACAARELRPAEGTQDHVPQGTNVKYDDAPPAFGQHWDTPAPFNAWFYDSADRPPVEQLVHNLEHGYTVVWYDETIADDKDALVELEGVAKKFDELADQGAGGTSNMRAKLKVVPWTSDDGEAFPDGQHLAMTHWSTEVADADKGAFKGKTDGGVGVWQYCSEFSGEALQDFMSDYPYTSSPEPLVEE